MRWRLQTGACLPLVLLKPLPVPFHCCCVMGVCHGVQASGLNPKAALPLLGLAQINLLQKENTNAITLLEKALQFAPGWNDALMASCSSLNLAQTATRRLSTKNSPILLLSSKVRPCS